MPLDRSVLVSPSTEPFKSLTTTSLLLEGSLIEEVPLADPLPVAPFSLLRVIMFSAIFWSQDGMHSPALLTYGLHVRLPC